MNPKPSFLGTEPIWFRNPRSSRYHRPKHNNLVNYAYCNRSQMEPGAELSPNPPDSERCRVCDRNR